MVEMAKAASADRIGMMIIGGGLLEVLIKEPFLDQSLISEGNTRQWGLCQTA